MKFMVDHMLIKLGKYLRILGYDAAWNKDLRTHELILRANIEDRIFLTRNTRLADQYPPVKKSIVIGSTDPVEQLYEVVRQTGLDIRTFLFSRCIKCNLMLDKVADKAEIRAAVHPNVYESFDQFFKCQGCGTVFWLGSHVRNTCAKLKLPECSIRPG